jgi:uncharacterized protein (TIGR02145 family)
MQAMTQEYCANMTVYNGSNPNVILTLNDTRNNQTYQIAKLADNNCWMLNNLKIANYNATSTDTNLTNKSSFTIPALDTTDNYDVDNPYVYGPVPGDSSGNPGSTTSNSAITTDTFYGYLYNWSAATAGESQTTMPAGSGNAPNSICPKNWRLPTGGSTGEFAWLNAKMNNPSATSPSTSSSYYANWQNTGPFRGVFSGNWLYGFYGQGDVGVFWSGSADPSGSYGAFYLGFGSSDVYPGIYNYRYTGIAVRCLLN